MSVRFTFPAITVLAILFLWSCQNTRKDYYPNGILRSEITIKHGKYHGRALFYYEDGTKQMECFYSDGKLEGPMIRYYNTGRQKESIFYRNNKPDSLCKTWDPKGNLILLCTYRDSLLHGPYTEFYDNGLKKIQGQYVGGLFDGKWFYYSSDGFIVGLGEFTNGTGVQKAYDERGSLKEVVYYLHGKKKN